MKKLIMKLLGLDTLVSDIAYLKETLDNVEAKNAEIEKSQQETVTTLYTLSTKVDEVSEAVEAVEDFDADDFVREDDVNDRIESYLNDNDYVTQSYCDDEIETKVSDAIDDTDIDSKIESAIEDIDLDEKVKDIVISEMQKTHPVLMTEETIRKEVSETVKVTLERVVKAMADQQG